MAMAMGETTRRREVALYILQDPGQRAAYQLHLSLARTRYVDREMRFCA